MPKIYSVNVGSNTSHSAIARSPIFDDGTFIFVSFPTRERVGTQSYTKAALPYVRSANSYRTHADPDWANLTYGDYCLNPRAGALKRVERGDILLFWGLLWRNRTGTWEGFTGERAWFVLGALRVTEFLVGGGSAATIPQSARKRASHNAHMDDGITLRNGHRVFVGDLEHSRLLEKAVALDVAASDGLLYRAFTAANGMPLTLNGTPSWKSSLRSCRLLWDLDTATGLERATFVHKAIAKLNGFRLLGGL